MGGGRAGSIESARGWSAQAWPARLAWLAVALGIGARLRGFIESPGFSTDEELLVLGLFTQPWAELWEPLPLGQAAAPLWLLLEKTLGTTLGWSEAVLRLPQIVGGCLAVPFAWTVTRKLLPEPVAAAATLLFALGPAPILYSYIFKPYGLDPLLTLLLLDRVLHLKNDPDSVRDWGTLILLGTVAILLSTASVFVAGTVGVIGLGIAGRRRSKTALTGIATTGVVWLGTLVILRLTAYAAASDPTTPPARYLRAFWDRWFLVPNPEGLLARLAHLLDELLSRNLLHFGWSDRGVAWVAGTLLLIGVASLAVRRQWITTLGVGLPIGSVLVAAGLAVYPVVTRLVLFAAPLSAVALAAGTWAALKWLPGRARDAVWVAAMAGGILSAAWSLRSMPALGRPPHDRAVIETLGRGPGGHDPLYIFPGAVPAWLYYSTDWTKPDTATVKRLIEIIDLQGPAPLFRLSRELFGPPPDPGDSALAVNRAGRVVAVGRATGRSRPVPPTWAPGEAARIRRLAQPCVSLILSTIRAEERAALLESIRQLGGRVAESPAPQSERVCF